VSTRRRVYPDRRCLTATGQGAIARGFASSKPAAPMRHPMNPASGLPRAPRAAREACGRMPDRGASTEAFADGDSAPSALSLVVHSARVAEPAVPFGPRVPQTARPIHEGTWRIERRRYRLPRRTPTASIPRISMPLRRGVSLPHVPMPAPCPEPPRWRDEATRPSRTVRANRAPPRRSAQRRPRVLPQRLERVDANAIIRLARSQPRRPRGAKPRPVRKARRRRCGNAASW